MDFHIIVVVAMLLFYGAVNEAKEALRIGGDEIAVQENENNSEEPPRVMTLVIVEDIEESEEINPSVENEAPMLPWIENPQIMLPWIEGVKPKAYEAYDDDEDTSGESNSDEYSDTDTELETDIESALDSESGTNSASDTDKESNYYHEDDYLKNKIMKKIVKLNVDSNSSKLLRNRWKSCQKKAAKYCRQACVVAYKNACDEHSCKKKLKKTLKKQCKRNCKQYFVET